MCALWNGQTHLTLSSRPWDSEGLFSSLGVWGLSLFFNEPLEAVLKDGMITLVVSSLSLLFPKPLFLIIRRRWVRLDMP